MVGCFNVTCVSARPVSCWQRLKEFLQRWLITTLAVLVAAHIVPGIDYSSKTALLVATLTLGLLNAFVRPIMMIISAPLLILTLGLFTFVINAALLYFVGHLIKGFDVHSFGSALVGAVIVSIVSLILNSFTKTGDSRISVKRGKAPPPPPRRDDGGGPVIDV